MFSAWAYPGFPVSVLAYRLLLVVYSLLLFSLPASVSGNDADVVYEQGRLSVDFRSVPLEDALQRVARQTGVRITTSVRLTEPVVFQFSDVPLETGIRQLLAGTNYILFHQPDTASDSGRTVSRVVVLGKGASAGGSATRRQSGVAAMQRPAPRPSRAMSSHRGGIVIQRRRAGHYVQSGKVNGNDVEFIVDTGATLVAVSGRLAADLGLTYGREMTIETANGKTTGFSTILDQVSLGPLRMSRVRAVILPDMDSGHRALLGMSFLGSFDLIQKKGELQIKPP